MKSSQKIHSQETNVAPGRRPGPKTKLLSSNHQFSGAMLVSGRVFPIVNSARLNGPVLNVFLGCDYWDQIEIVDYYEIRLVI